MQKENVADYKLANLWPQYKNGQKPFDKDSNRIVSYPLYQLPGKIWITKQNNNSDRSKYAGTIPPYWYPENRPYVGFDDNVSGNHENYRFGETISSLSYASARGLAKLA